MKRFLAYARIEYELSSLDSIMAAPPTAELEPLQEGRLVQTDEEDMGLTYAELSDLGRLRKQSACGPYSTFCRLMHTWRASATPAEIAHKVGNFLFPIKTISKYERNFYLASLQVKHFYRCYAINRHKVLNSFTKLQKRCNRRRLKHIFSV